MNAAKVLEDLKRRFPNEPEYHQAVEEVLSTIEEEYNKHPEFDKANLIERLCIPDRVYQFRVTWVDDKGNVQTNMGYRVQHNNAIGPYKGGIRFHASVNLGILKFLAFEQTFKNSLTTLPMGGGKGGSDFSPRGKSNAEVMRFTQAFMLELWRHIGPETDVPAGDIGVGGREVGFMFGMYKKLSHEFTGTFTGKGREFGGSLIRPEATGYGNIYFLMEMLKRKGTDLKGKVVLLDFTVYQSAVAAPHNLMLRDLYNKYASQGLEIYQVSLDADEHFWKTSADNLPWVCVRDENGIYSTNAALYGVQNLPAFFLINRNNELRARGETVKDLEGTIKSML